MRPVLREIFEHLGQKFLLVLRLKRLPLKIDVVVRKVERIHDIQLVRAVKHRRGDVETKCLCRQREMDLEYLSDVHTGRHAERI